MRVRRLMYNSGHSTGTGWEASLGKNIIICSDGTGNSDVKGRGTNVFKLFEAIDLNGHRTKPHLDAQSRSTMTAWGPGIHAAQGNGRRIRVRPARNVRKLYKELGASTIPATGYTCSGSAAAPSPYAPSPG